MKCIKDGNRNTKPKTNKNEKHNPQKNEGLKKFKNIN